jgi:hypothetical protein
LPGTRDAPGHIAVAERLAGLVAAGRTTVIADAADPNLEHPESFQHAVLEFRPTDAGGGVSSAQ